jgi:hypothetical protein
MDDKEQQAKQRFMVLNILRFSGVALVLLGIAILSGKFGPAVPEIAGTLLVILGAADFFIVPVMLKKAWKKADGRQG